MYIYAYHTVSQVRVCVCVYTVKSMYTHTYYTVSRVCITLYGIYIYIYAYVHTYTCICTQDAPHCIGRQQTGQLARSTHYFVRARISVSAMPTE